MPRRDVGLIDLPFASYFLHPWYGAGVLGVFQLGVPCMLLVLASRACRAGAELLGRSSVLGPLWRCSARGVSGGAKLIGGIIVLDRLRKEYPHFRRHAYCRPEPAQLALSYFLSAAAWRTHPVRLRSRRVRGGTLKVEPVITAPAGKKLRYDVVTKRSGRSGNSNSSQGGNVTVGDNGKASLSQVSVSVAPQDRYEVSVEVYDGSRLVAAKTLRHPD